MNEIGEAGIGMPGGVSVSLLSVYDWEAADGHHGGSPHFHTVSREGYVVVGGAGEVHTLTTAGHERTTLAPGRLVWFTPGTIHRLVNHGDLRIVTLMQNAGLPESGDAILTFPLNYLADAQTYRAAHSLPEDAASRGDAARARRDLALQGYAELREAVAAHGAEALVPYYEAAGRIVAERVDEWTDLWAAGPRAQAHVTGTQLAALARGDVSHLTQASVRTSDAHGDMAWGMCGRLTTWPRPE